MAKRKRKSKNKLISASFIFIWVILLGVCIFVYRSNKTLENNTVASINDNKLETAVEKVKDNDKNESKDISSKTDDEGEQHNKNNSEKTEILTDSNEVLNEDNSQKVDNDKKIDDNSNNNEKMQSDENIDKSTQESTQQNNTYNSTAESSNSGKVDESKDNSESKKEVKKEVKKEPVNIVTFDPNNKVIVIDPGHANRSNSEEEPIAPGSSIMKIKDGGGATGRFTQVPEYEVAMEVSKILKILLEEKGFTVIMTKTEHDVSLGNVERAQIGNEANAALVIRVHADSYEKSSAHGATMLVPDKTKYTEAIYDESKRCGEIVMDILAEEVGMYNRGLKYRSDITGFNWSKVPVILIEMGFMSNEEEDRLLASPEYQDRLAKGLADGIEEALSPLRVQ